MTWFSAWPWPRWASRSRTISRPGFGAPDGTLPLVVRRSAKVLTRRLRRGVEGLQRGPDEVAAEEPLAVELDGTLVATTMRTTGHDFELAAGFCFTEGLLGAASVRSCRYCGPVSSQRPAQTTGGGRAPI